MPSSKFRPQKSVVAEFHRKYQISHENGTKTTILRTLDLLILNTWSDETTSKKGDAGPRPLEVMEPSCLRGVRPFRRLGMHPSGPCEVAFCIDKALIHAPFKS